MKRNIGNIIICAAVLLSVGACTKKVLNTQPFDKVSEDVIWNNSANAWTFVYSTYASIIPAFQGGGQNSAPFTLNTIGFDGIYNAGARVFTGTLDRNTDMGFNNWSQVRQCNMIIDKAGASKGISDDDKKELIAQGKFLRAMSYFNVARKIGRIVWIDTVLTPEDSLLLPSTASPAESYKYIIQDLEDAVRGLSTSKVPGIANKYTAAAMLSEVCLEALAYQNYPNAANINSSNPIIDTAIKYAQLVINEGGYTLDPDYGGMFNEVNPQSSEIIMAMYQKSSTTEVVNTPMQLMLPNINNGAVTQYGGSPLYTGANDHELENWIQGGPTYNMADAYLVIDKNDPSKALPWDETSQFKNAIDNNVSIPSFEIPKAGGETSVEHGMIKPGSNETIWTLTNEGRDARWAASIVSDSSDLYGWKLTTSIKGNATRWMKIDGFSYYVSLTNLYWRKGIYNNVSPRPFYNVPTDYHYVITRLGRVYLNLAEAYLLKGDIPDAVAAFNMTRTIHGQLPPSTATTLADAWTDYKRERRVDLVLEDDYYWSLLRWGRYGGPANHNIASGGIIPELTDVPQVIDISKSRKAFSVVEGSFFGSNNIRIFEPKRYLFPIAQGYLDRNSKFGPQNPGW
jgi:hypothetical protein